MKKKYNQVYKFIIGDCIRVDLEEIKVALIPEDEPTEEELMEIELGNREITEGKYSRSKYYKKSENLTLRHFFCEAKNHLAGYGSVFLSSDAYNSD